MSEIVDNVDGDNSKSSSQDSGGFDEGDLADSENEPPETTNLATDDKDEAMTSSLGDELPKESEQFGSSSYP